MSKLSNIFICLLITSVYAYAQSDYPNGYFEFPINPGQTNYLSGNMGELRGNHYHAGLDIKTGGKTGLPVHAAHDASVTRIKVSSWGYGRVLYMTDSKGYTSVYAHLERYEKSIADYVRAKQYEYESYEIELFPPKDKFTFKKGDIIGYSGNSGSSGGPHLHFEIRDRFQQVLNPLYFGFEKEIKDNVPPSIAKIAVTPLSINSRVKNTFTPEIYSPTKRGSGTYSMSNIEAFGTIGLEIQAFDRLNGSSNRNGVIKMEVIVNGKQTYLYHLKKFSFGQTKYINQHINFASKFSGIPLQKLYIDEGNELPVYKSMNRGKLYIQPDSTYNVAISVWDAHENKSTVTFNILGKQPKKPTIFSTNCLSGMDLSHNVIDNTLLIEADVTTGTPCVGSLETVNGNIRIEPAYITPKTTVYLWDLRKALPSSFSLGANKIDFNFIEMAPSTRNTLVSIDNDFSVYISDGCLYDTLYVEGKKTGNIFEINSESIPLRKSVLYTLSIPEDKNKEKAAVYSVTSRGYLLFESANKKNDKFSIYSRSLGRFTVEEDTLAPSVTPIQLSGNEVQFRIKDNLSGIKSYRATINGKFLLLNYDYKRNLVWSETLNGEPLQGLLNITVTDNMNNTTTYTTKL